MKKKVLVHPKTMLLAVSFLVGAATPVALARDQRGQVRPVWGHAILGDYIGKGGIVIAEQEGRDEIYVASDSDYWVAFRPTFDTHFYETCGFSPSLDWKMAAMAVGQVVPGGAQEIVAIRSDGIVLVHDGADKFLFHEIDTGMPDLGGLLLYDLDGDGAAEILVTSPDELRVMAGDGTVLWSAPAGGTNIAVGQMDLDPGLEIATTDGSVVDVASQTVQWVWFEGFGRFVEAADSDDDGIDELIVGHSDVIFGFDVDRELPQWSRSAPSIREMQLYDVAGDALPEIAIAAAAEDRVVAYDLRTRERVLEIDQVSGEDILNFALGDVDDDGEPEAVLSARGRILVFEIPSGEVKWDHFDAQGSLIGPECADIDGDGAAEIFVAAPRFSFVAGTGGRILMFDGANRSLRTVSQQVGTGSSEILTMALRDVDLDGIAEIIVASQWAGGLEVYKVTPSGDGFELVFQVAEGIPNGAFSSVDAADVDEDGEVEILAGTDERSTSGNASIHAYDFPSGEEEWRFDSSLPVEISDIAVGDLDGDGHLEVAGIAYGSWAYVVDGLTGALESSWLGRFSAMRIAESPGSRRPFLAMADDDPSIMSFRYRDGEYVPGPSRTFEASHFPTEFYLDPAHRLLIVGLDSTLQFYRPVDGPEPFFQTQEYRWLWYPGIWVDRPRRAIFGGGGFAVVEFQWQE